VKKVHRGRISDRGTPLLDGVTMHTLSISPPRAPRALTTDDPNWASLGACVADDPDALFVRGRAQRQARLVCRSCPVRLDCLADALDNRTEFGVWGGMTERERRALLNQHPNVRSWRAEIRRQLAGRQVTARSA